MKTSLNPGVQINLDEANETSQIRFWDVKIQ